MFRIRMHRPTIYLSILFFEKSVYFEMEISMTITFKLLNFFLER